MLEEQKVQLVAQLVMEGAEEVPVVLVMVLLEGMAMEVGLVALVITRPLILELVVAVRDAEHLATTAAVMVDQAK
jgi:hypothetical protein